MKNMLVALTALGTLCVTTSSLQAATVEVEWKNPDEFRDIRPANESKKNFRRRVFASIEGFVVDFAERLPEDQKLKVTFTDLDLAGQVWPAHFIGLGIGGGNTNDVRMIRRIDIPRMSFTYQLLDADDAVVQEGEADLKDMAFQERFNPAFRSEDLRYEREMLRTWFRKEFTELQANVND